MKVETTPLENRELRVVVEATPEETENARRNAALKLGKKVRVPGFRPGKAPYPILLKHLDPIALQEETIETFLDKVYPEILEQENIEPFAQGRLESILNINPLTLEIHIPLQPLVEIGDYHAIRIPYEPPVVTDEEVDEALERLRKQNAVIEPVERSIQEGDIVYIDLIGYRIENGEITSQSVLEEHDIPIQVLAEGKTAWEYPFQGFSKELLGKQANDHFGIDFSFPEDSPSLTFKGMNVHFDVTIKQVKGRVLPELNDEFAQSVGEYTSLEELRSSVRSMLEAQAQAEYQEEYDTKVIQELVNCSDIEYPLVLVENERKAYIKELQQRLNQLNIDLDLYKKIKGLSEEQFEEEVNKNVEYRVKSSLALLEIAKKENIRFDPLKVTQETQTVMQDLVERSKDSRIPKQLLDSIAIRISERNMYDQVLNGAIEKLRQIAKGEENNIEEQESNSEVNPPETETSGFEGMNKSEIEAVSMPEESITENKSDSEQ